MKKMEGSKMRRAWRKALSFLLSLCMIISCMDGFSTTARADGEWSKFADGVTTLGTSGIGSPKASGTNEDGWAGDYVYYGKYDGTNPTKYRVLDPNSAAFGVTGGSMLLDCDAMLYPAEFHYISNEWSFSTIRSDLNGDAFLNKANNFTSVEKGAIAASSKSAAATGDKADGNGWDYLNWTSLTDDMVFLLDAKEATNASYGYAKKIELKARKKSGGGSRWWLRSPDSNYSNYVGYVDSDGDIEYSGVDSKFGVSPAFNINLSSVLFSSVINPETTGSYGKEYKLTLKDGNTTITPGTLSRSGDTVTVPYTVTDSDTSDGIAADTVSVLILGSSNAIKYYAPLTGTFAMTGGSGTFDVPAAFDAENDTVYLLAEDTHEGNTAKYLTDYASEPVAITVPASADSGNFTALQTLIGNTADSGTLALKHDYTAEAGEGYINIPSGKTITIDLNGHTIDRNLTAETENGYVIFNAGILTLKDDVGGGKITGARNTKYGGGVYNKGTFTLNSGEISGNKATHGGCGVYNQGTFTMNDGTITGNSGNLAGGGVYNQGMFTMNGGTISGNTINFYGGGVDNNKIFVMNGGTITGNSSGLTGGGVENDDTFTMNGGTISGNTAQEGGGVLSYQASFNIGSRSVIKITGNTDEDGTSNVCLYDGELITVNSAPTEGSEIGVNVYPVPTSDTPVTIASDCKGSVSYFTSDNAAYRVVKDGDAAKVMANTKVTFDKNGGSGTMSPQYIVENTINALNANTFTRDNYYFNGWNTKDDGSGTPYADKANITVTEDVTLYAQWVETLKITTTSLDSGNVNAAYSQTFHSSGGIGNKTWAVTAGSLPAGLSLGGNNGVISGTSTASGTYNFTVTVTDEKSHTASKAFSLEINKVCTINFDKNGGKGTMVAQNVPYNTATSLNANAFTCDGYSFAGWNTQANGGGDSYPDKANVTLTADTTLYAQWAGNSYTVVFDENGGTGTMDDMTATVGENFTFPACGFTAPANKVFSRWELSGDDGVRNPGDTLQIVPNYIWFDEILITAKWKPATYTFVEEVPATCTEKGKKAHYKAEDGRLYSKSGDDTYTLIEDESSLDIKALGHIFTYSAAGAVITAHCGNVGCTLDDQTATLSLNKTGLSFGDVITPTVTLSDGWTAANGFTTIPTAADVKYVGCGSTTYAESTAAPTNAGTYTAKVTVGTATASVNFSVEKADPTYTIPTGLTATYGDKLSDVSLANFTGWSWVDGTQGVGNAGTHTFKATYTPEDTSNYNVISNVELTVTVGKASISPVVNIDGWTAGQTPEVPSVTGNPGNGSVSFAYKAAAADDAAYSETVPTSVGDYVVRATIAETANYLSGTATASFRIKAVPRDFYDDLRDMIRAAIALGGERTVFWNRGNTLPYDVMKLLEDHPQVTLVFEYSYEGKDYKVTMPGSVVKAYPDIYWYGPLYLYAHYGKNEAALQTYVVQRGDTLSRITAKLHTTVRRLVELNGIKNPNRIYPGQKILYGESAAPYNVQNPASGTYVVQRGDTLSRIAAKLGVSIGRLVQLNKIQNPNRIWAGQVLRY